jgi:hypothetical protein
MIVFQHVYYNGEGRRIAEEQDDTCRRLGFEVVRGISDPSDNPQRYEGVTLQKLWEYSFTSESEPICYIHTKGATNPNRKGCEDWRHSMEAVVLHRWQDCLKALETCDCYGAHLPTDDRYFFPGNFWWSNTSHIRTLPSPIEWAEKLCGRKGENVRYGYEDWITLSRPGVVAKAKYEWKP